MNEISRKELVTVITDFIEMGHVENIVAMFSHDPSLYDLAGELIEDERFMVRVGVAVLFEELAAIKPVEELSRAIPSLRVRLNHETPYVRGEAVNLLGMINSPEALELVAGMRDDPDSQVAEIAADVLASRG